MTIGVSITLDAKGGSSAASEARKVEQAVRGIAGAEREAAAAAHKRGQAQGQANHHGGAHRGFIGGIHAFAALGGGEVGHVGHAGARVARAGLHMGASGLLLAGAGLAVNGLLEAATEYGEKMGEVVKRTQEIAAKMRQAEEAAGKAGLATYQREGMAINRLFTAGATWDDIRKGQLQGLSVDSQAELYGTRNRKIGMAAASFATRFGVSTDKAAAEIAKMGGVRDDANAEDVAAAVAERIQNRRISAGERKNAHASAGPLADIADIEHRTDAARTDNLRNGRTAAAAADELNRMTSPQAYAMTASWKEATEQSEVLQTISKNTNIMALGIQAFLHTAGLGGKDARSKALEFDQQTLEAMSNAGAHE